MSDFVIFGESEIQAEVAITDKEQARGLMFVEWPPPVMAFPYRKAGVHKFWMKNTPSPLDIIFCYAGKIVAIESGEAFSEKKVGPDEPTDLVVELPAGMAEELGIAVGMPVQLRCGLETLARRIEYAISKRT